MTITINADLGSSTANAYGLMADVDAYHTSRGNSYWASVSTEPKKACVIRATDYIDKRFRAKFRGSRQNFDQALAFPRIGARDNDNYSLDNMIPAQLFKAMCEYALRAAMYNVLAPDAQRLAPAQDMSVADPNAAAEDGVIAGPIRSKTEQVGPIRETTVYDSTSQIAALARAGENSRATQSTLVNDLYVPQYPEADMLLEELIVSNASISLHLGG